MDAQPARSGRWRTLPLGLVGMLGLVLAVETGVERRAGELADFQVLSTRFAARAATRAAPGNDVLVVGDSQMQFGFDPAEFERRTGLRAYDLAVPGTSTPVAFALLSRAIDAGARPRAIVFGHMNLDGGPRSHLQALAELLGPIEAAGVARANRDPELAAAVLSRRLFPSMRYRNSLKAAILGAFGASPAPTHLPRALARQHWNGWLAHRGADLRPRNERSRVRMEPELERRVYSQPWRIHPVSERYYRRTVALAAGHGIPVFWVIAPILPEALARRDELALDADHTRNLRAVMARTPSVIVLDARRAGFSSSEFLDSSHLNADGAARLTAMIAEAVESHLSTTHKPADPRRPAWVALGSPDSRTR